VEDELVQLRRGGNTEPGIRVWERYITDGYRPQPSVHGVRGERRAHEVCSFQVRSIVKNKKRVFVLRMCLSIQEGN